MEKNYHPAEVRHSVFATVFTFCFDRKWRITCRLNLAAEVSKSQWNVSTRWYFFFILCNLLWRQELGPSSKSQLWRAGGTWSVLHITIMDGPVNLVSLHMKCFGLYRYICSHKVFLFGHIYFNNYAFLGSIDLIFHYK